MTFKKIKVYTKGSLPKDLPLAGKPLKRPKMLSNKDIEELISNEY